MPHPHCSPRLLPDPPPARLRQSKTEREPHLQRSLPVAVSAREIVLAPLPEALFSLVAYNLCPKRLVPLSKIWRAKSATIRCSLPLNISPRSSRPNGCFGSG